MKKILSILLIILMIFSSIAMADGYSDHIDKLKQQWNEAETQEEKDRIHEEAEEFRMEHNPDYTGSQDGSGDNRYNETKVEQLRERNRDAYEELSERISQGENIKIDVDEDGQDIYRIPDRVEREERRRRVDEMSSNERAEHLDEVKEDRGRNKDGEELNEDLFIEEGVVVFGDIEEINRNTHTTQHTNYKDGEYRYLGYDENGNLYLNPNFPPDYSNDDDPSMRDWYDRDELTNNEVAKNLIGYEGSDRKVSREEKLEDAEKLLQTNDRWKNSGWTAEEIVDTFVYHQSSDEYGGGTFTGVHENNGHIYYETFNVQPDPYEVTEEITSTIPGVVFTFEDEDPEPPEEDPEPPEEDPEPPEEDPEPPGEDPEPPGEDPEPPGEDPEPPGEDPEPPEIAEGNIIIEYYCVDGHGVFDRDSVNLQIKDGKEYTAKIPAKNFHPKHKIIDSKEKEAKINFSKQSTTIRFNYEDYYAEAEGEVKIYPYKLKSGYGFEVKADIKIDTNFKESEITGNPRVTVDFLGNTYQLEKISGEKLDMHFELPYNPDSMIQSRKIYTPVELEDGVYKAQIRLNDLESPLEPIEYEDTINVEIEGHMYQDDYTKPN